MGFICIEIESGIHIGDCTLPVGQYDPHGTEHRFGDDNYLLQSTYIDQDKGTMYFKRKK